MAELTWAKADARANSPARTADRFKFMVGGLLLLGAVAYLIMSSTSSGARYFMTVEDLLADEAYVGQTVRISGSVIGDTIVYDTSTLTINFTIAHIPAETPDLALALHLAATDPNVARVAVHIEDEVMPDLLQNEAQAILTGTLGADGVFYASELLLKCPSRYEENVPAQVEL